MAQDRQRVMEAAYARDPDQFSGGVPQVPKPRRQAWINKPKNAANLSAEHSQNKDVNGSRDPSK